MRLLPVLTLAAAAALSAACATPPPSFDDHPYAYRDAIGDVTVSTPVLTPLVARAAGEKLLDLSDFYDENALREMILQPDMASSLLHFQSLRLALQGTYSGPQVSSSRSRSDAYTFDPNGGSSLTRSKELSESVTQTTPGVPEAGFGDGRDPAIQEAFLEVFAKDGALKNKLAPDQLATLIAAYKTYMVNLEDYYNSGGLASAMGDSFQEYVPYKVHFTVTAEPGWYTRHNLMDAVIEVAFGDENSDIRVLTVTPAETAQAIDEFTASLRQFLLMAGVTASANALALNAQVERIDDVAQQLQGLHTNKTLTVGYPTSSSCRIRFRAHRTPTLEGKDLQPISRILTAIVLVKKDATTVYGGTKTTRTISSRSATFRQRAYFSPALRTKDGKFDRGSLRQRLLNMVTVIEPHKRRYPDGPTSAEVWEACAIEIPPWLGDAAKPLQVEARGTYRFSGIENLNKLALVTRLLALEKKANALTKTAAADVGKKEQAVKAAQATVSKAKIDLEKAALALANATTNACGCKECLAAKKEPDIAALRAAVEKAKERLGKAEGDKRKADGELAKAKATSVTAKAVLTAATAQRKEAEEDERATWATALSSGRATVRFEIDAPRYLFKEARGYDVVVWGRVVGGGQNTGWTRLGEGDVEGVLNLSGLDLSDTAATATPTSLRDFGKAALAVSLEVGLYRAQDEPDTSAPVRTAVTDFRLHARSSSSYALNGVQPEAAKSDKKPDEPAKPGAESDSKPGDGSTIKLDVGKLELRMEGAPAPPEPKEPKDGGEPDGTKS